MKKYLVPCAALAGIALLTPHANATDLIMKSRAICAGRPGRVPVAVRNTGGSGEIWGLDAGLAIGAASVTAVDPNNAFTLTGSTANDVVVTGNTFVGTGTQPSLYFGFVKGTSGISSAAATLQGVGFLNLQVAAGTAVGTLVDIGPVANYNVENDGNTGTADNRPGSTAVTSTATAGAPVVAETVNVPATVAATGIQVPLHKVVVSAPGNVNLSADNLINSGDLANLAAALANKTTLTDARKVAADSAPLNGYTPGTPNGTGGGGGSYGDGVINSGDLAQLAAKLANKAPNFPVCE